MYADRGTKQVDFQIGDPGHYEHHHGRNKLEGKWKPHYHVIEDFPCHIYVIENSLIGYS